MQNLALLQKVQVLFTNKHKFETPNTDDASKLAAAECDVGFYNKLR